MCLGRLGSGVLAGLLREPYPSITMLCATSRPATTQDAVDVVFQTLNRYLSVAVGEHLGYIFTGSWTGLAGLAIVQSDVVAPVFGTVGTHPRAALRDLLTRVRWILRSSGLETRRQPRPNHLHRLVTLVARPLGIGLLAS